MATGIQVPYIVEIDSTTAGGAEVYELIHEGTIVDAFSLSLSANAGTLLIERAAYNAVTDTYGAYATIAAAYPVTGVADAIVRAGIANAYLLAAQATCGQFDRIRVTSAGAGATSKLFLTLLAPQQQ